MFLILPLLCFLFPLGAGAEGISGTDLTTTKYLSPAGVQECKVDVKSSSGSGSASKRIGGTTFDSRKVLGDAVGSSGVPQALITDVRYWSNPDYTRIVVTLDREVPFAHHKLRRDKKGSLPERIYIDFSGARIAPGVKDLPIGDGLLKTARVGQYRSDVVRIVLD
ncbi:MAG: AMIN domain-containing protein, partial [Deltaproteobacteria bacterium]|nr:AMIN domain-containing protein [Deltaproteobacteria bacterium]